MLANEGKMTVWVYTNGEITKVFATEEAALLWFETNDPEGVAFEYPVEGAQGAVTNERWNETLEG